MPKIFICDPITDSLEELKEKVALFDKPAIVKT